MKLIFKLTTIFMAIFLSLFLLINLFGLLSIEDIKLWFETIKEKPSYIIGGLVTTLLFIDLILSIPTMITVLLGGYFLGFFMGIVYALLGLALASFTGYCLSRRYGQKGISFISKDNKEIEEMQKSFSKYGVGIIILSRAMPMLPEISSALAGVTRMPFKKFFMAWLASSLPYVMTLSYLGSISNRDNPQWILIVIVLFNLLLWLSWSIFFRKKDAT